MHMLVYCSFTQILKICRSNMKFQAYSIAPKERSLFPEMKLLINLNIQLLIKSYIMYTDIIENIRN